MEPVTLADLEKLTPLEPVTLDALQMFLDMALTAREHLEFSPHDRGVATRLVSFEALFIDALRRFDWSGLDDEGLDGIRAIDSDHSRWLAVGTAVLAYDGESVMLC